MNAVIEIPEEIAASIKLPKHRLNGELVKELALQLYRERMISFANAHRLAGMSKVAFHHLLGDRQIPRHYGEDAYEQDLDALTEWRNANTTV